MGRISHRDPVTDTKSNNDMSHVLMQKNEVGYTISTDNVRGGMQT